MSNSFINPLIILHEAPSLLGEYSGGHESFCLHRGYKMVDNKQRKKEENTLYWTMIARQKGWCHGGQDFIQGHQQRPQQTWGEPRLSEMGSPGEGRALQRLGNKQIWQLQRKERGWVLQLEGAGSKVRELLRE